jgi:RNA polymerase sigma-70 factor (ECF subfamily)
MGSFFDRLAAAAPEAARALGEPEDVERRFTELAREAAAAWPGVTVPRDALADAVAAKLTGDDPPAFGPDLVHEVHLALGCGAGDAAAIKAFDRRYLDVVPQALAHMRLPAATVDAVRAAVQEKLLVREGDGPPRILEYAGRGKLRGLVQVSAVRAALSMVRAGGRERAVSDSDLGALPSPEVDPELRLMKERYRAAFAEAFAEAVRALAPRDRNLLRMHFLGGVTLDQLAAMYGVHRATVVRWLAAVRKGLLVDTRKNMRSRLDAAPGELDSILRLIESRLDVSVQRLLTSMEAPGSAREAPGSPPMDVPGTSSTDAPGSPPMDAPAPPSETRGAEGDHGAPHSDSSSTSANSGEKG